MFKRLALAAAISAVVLTGCQSTGNDSSAATLDRYQAIGSLSVQIEEVGFKQAEDLENIPAGVEQFVNMADALVRRQYDVMGAFREQAELYADVSAFLYAYPDATSEELTEAIERFDAGAETHEQKIGPKIHAYNASLETISEHNLQLGIELLEQTATATILLTEYGPQIAQQTAIGAGLSMFNKNKDDKTADNDMILALIRARDQVQLAREANHLIKLEKETIAAIDSLQADLESQG